DMMNKGGPGMLVINGLIDQGMHLYQQYEMFEDAVDRGRVRSAARIFSRNATDIGIQVVISEALGAAWGSISKGVEGMSFAESSVVRAESRTTKTLARGATAEVRTAEGLAPAVKLETNAAAGAPALSEAIMRVRIVEGLEAAVGTAEKSIQTA